MIARFETCEKDGMGPNPPKSRKWHSLKPAPMALTMGAVLRPSRDQPRKEPKR